MVLRYPDSDLFSCRHFLQIIAQQTCYDCTQSSLLCYCSTDTNICQLVLCYCPDSKWALLSTALWQSQQHLNSAVISQSCQAASTPEDTMLLAKAWLKCCSPFKT